MIIPNSENNLSKNGMLLYSGINGHLPICRTLELMANAQRANGDGIRQFSCFAWCPMKNEALQNGASLKESSFLIFTNAPRHRLRTVTRSTKEDGYKQLYMIREITRLDRTRNARKREKPRSDRQVDNFSTMKYYITIYMETHIMGM